jgi:hypothetical protein
MKIFKKMEINKEELPFYSSHGFSPLLPRPRAQFINFRKVTEIKNKDVLIVYRYHM